MCKHRWEVENEWAIKKWWVFTHLCTWWCYTPSHFYAYPSHSMTFFTFFFLHSLPNNQPSNRSTSFHIRKYLLKYDKIELFPIKRYFCVVLFFSNYFFSPLNKFKCIFDIKWIQTNWNDSITKWEERNKTKRI